MKRAAFLIFVGAFGCAQPAPIDDGAPALRVSSLTGGNVCTVGLTCTVGTGVYPCALDVLTELPMCCSSGCVDDAGYCQTGVWGTACGAAGSSCVFCAAGLSCSAGACTSECSRTSGGACSTRSGSGVCVCCTTCFDPNSGECVSTGNTDCGHGGAVCVACGGNAPYCHAGSCSSTP